MEVRKEDFPIVIQAYEMLDSKEIFVAEQVVNNQSDVNTFTARYAGKLIKAKQFSTVDTNRNTAATTTTTTTHTKKKNSAGTVILVLLLILIILAAIGFYTGWFQQHFNL